MKTSLQHERRSTPNGRNPQTSSAGRTKHLRSVAKKQRQDFMASIQRLKPVSSKLLTSDIKTSLWHEKKKQEINFKHPLKTLCLSHLDALHAFHAQRMKGQRESEVSGYLTLKFLFVRPTHSWQTLSFFS